MPLAIADLPLLVRPRQVAEVLGITESQVRTLIRIGRLPHIAIGSRPHVPRDKIESFLTDTMVPACRDETPVPAFRRST